MKEKRVKFWSLDKTEPSGGNGVTTTILMKDPSMPGGYRIETSYPEIF